MDGTKLCSLYSYITNNLDYCGPQGAEELLKNYILNDTEIDKAQLALSKFEGLYPYLELISSKFEKEPIDYDVVEAYWLGNELLEEFDKSDMSLLINNLAKRGLPLSMAKKLIERLPESALPFHCFHVLFVGVGMVTGSVETNLQNMDRCRISCAEVDEIHDSYLLAKRAPLELTPDGYVLGKEQQVKLGYNLEFKSESVPVIKPNDVVSVHWETPVQKLDETQVENLKKYTERTLELAPHP